MSTNIEFYDTCAKYVQVHRVPCFLSGQVKCTYYYSWQLVKDKVSSEACPAHRPSIAKWEGKCLQMHVRRTLRALVLPLANLPTLVEVTGTTGPLFLTDHMHCRLDGQSVTDPQAKYVSPAGPFEA